MELNEWQSLREKKCERLKMALNEWQSVREKKKNAGYKIIMDQMRQKAMKRMDPQNDLRPLIQILRFGIKTCMVLNLDLIIFTEGGILDLVLLFKIGLLRFGTKPCMVPNLILVTVKVGLVKYL